MTVIGADRLRRRLAKMPKAVSKIAAKANTQSGEELVRIARILHPGDGENRAAIKGTPNADGSYLCDFGPKAKVTEGSSGPRPFVNPALSVTRKKHRARAARVMKKAVREVFGG